MLSSQRTNIRIADKWLVMIAVTLGMIMSLMDSTIVNVAIPQMQRVFRADIKHVQWVVTIYMLTQAAVIPIAPYLTARFGGKRSYVWTLIAFLLGSALCGFAWDLRSLIVFRLIQGIGGGILLPMVMILLYQAFPIQERGTAVSAMGIPLMAAPVLGPVLGGYLVSLFGWPWAFFINLPLGIIAIAIAQRVLRHTPGEQQTRFDAAGFLTIATGSATLLYGVAAVTSGDTSMMNILFLAGGVALLSAFVVFELATARRGQTALLDLRRFSDRTFAFSSLALVFFAFIRFGILFLIPIYLQTLRQQTALQAGALLAAPALATLALLPIGGRLTDRIGPRPVVIAGLSIFACAAALMMLLALNTPIWMIVGILILMGSAFGFAQQIPVSAMSRIEKGAHKEIANASTLVTVLHSTAAPLGVAMFSSFVQARGQQYALQLAGQGAAGALLQQQSSLLAMHESFLAAAFLALVAVAAMCCVPKRAQVQARATEAHLVETSIP